MAKSKCQIRVKEAFEKTFSYQHLRDHVVWDFILPELFGNKTVTVALRHSTCSAWQRDKISVKGQN